MKCQSSEAFERIDWQVDAWPSPWYFLTAEAARSSCRRKDVRRRNLVRIRHSHMFPGYCLVAEIAVVQFGGKPKTPIPERFRREGGAFHGGTGK